MTPETSAEICRLFFVEHWKVGTIAGQLGVHPDVVRRVLGLGPAPARAVHSGRAWSTPTASSSTRR